MIPWRRFGDGDIPGRVTEYKLGYLLGGPTSTSGAARTAPMAERPPSHRPRMGSSPSMGELTQILSHRTMAPTLAGGRGQKKRVSQSKKAGLIFPVSRIMKKLKNGRYAQRTSKLSGAYLTAVLEYLVVEILELAGQAAMDSKRKRITPRHIMLAIKNDEVRQGRFGDSR
jgi:histone H3/H4